VTRARRLALLRTLAMLTGVVLLAIGVRFLLVPHQAARFFGITPAEAAAAGALHYVIGLRDIWLAVIVMVLSAVGDWRGLALWLGLGVCVCLGDAAIAAVSSGRAMSVGFHLASGLYCGALGLACWRQHRAAGF
jgi:hypothetical protein